MKYDCKCLRCDEVEEYESPITNPDQNLPYCSSCAASSVDGEATPRMVRIFSRSYGSGGFILKGTGWHNKGGY